MKLYLPQQFDGNESFCLILLGITAVITFMLPPRFPMIVATAFFSIGLGIAMYVDFHLGIPPIDLYRINDRDQYELFDLILFITYSAYSYIYVYFLDKWKLRGMSISLYVLAWTFAGIVLEAFAVHFHVYTYKGWSLAYSFLFYIAALMVTLYIYFLMKRTYQQTKRDSSKDWT
ncbi:hypothetical protein [Brevibacillus migulae]|uniref:hypothetical protein n=1 Tax=Brevibacillus migulae TaxID=1644114 RepID=UPI00106DE2A3|nr:hypothetical protein [Brevibacillus migulae]